MQEFREYVKSLKRKIKGNKDETLFVCIGNDKIIWDSIGPLVGTYLKERIGEKKVLGDISHNICDRKDLIYYYPRMKNKFIVAIDSAISNEGLNENGEIFVGNDPIILGLGMNKNKGIIGDISIKAGISNINKIGKQEVKLISETIGRGICYWYKN